MRFHAGFRYREGQYQANGKWGFRATDYAGNPIKRQGADSEAIRRPGNCKWGTHYKARCVGRNRGGWQRRQEPVPAIHGAAGSKAPFHLMPDKGK